MLERKTSRIVLINEHSEILLLKYIDRKPADPARPTLLTYWVPPGGGLEDGESYEDAANQELEEEIGVSLTIGPWIWSRKRNLTLADGMRMVTERYFVARTGGGRIIPLNTTNDNFVSHRWWTLDEMHETSETLLPPVLSTLIAPILLGHYPSVPIDIDINVE
ncbi:MAG: NUDIX domain-containing protein [Candidatus Zixiibacteriota bacterium]